MDLEAEILSESRYFNARAVHIGFGDLISLSKLCFCWPRKGPKLKSIEVATELGPFLDSQKLAEAEILSESRFVNARSDHMGFRS